MKYGNLNFLEPSGPFQACNGTALPFTSCIKLFLYSFLTAIFQFLMLISTWKSDYKPWPNYKNSPIFIQGKNLNLFFSVIILASFTQTHYSVIHCNTDNTTYSSYEDKTASSISLTGNHRAAWQMDHTYNYLCVVRSLYREFVMQETQASI